MKKVLSLILALVMCLSLCSCFYYTEPQTNCPNCGGGIAYDVSYCEHCGVALQEEESTVPFEPLCFSGTGHKTFRDINIPAGNYVLVGTATITGTNFSVPNFDVSLKNSAGNYVTQWWSHLSSSTKNLEKMEPFAGPIKGGYLEVDAYDEVNWTITIEAAS